MNIQEAILKANKEGKYIYRESEMDINILPTNTTDCCLLLAEDVDRNKVGRCWNPYADDLIADDWQVR